MSGATRELHGIRVVEAALENASEDPLQRLLDAKGLAKRVAGAGGFLLSWKNGVTGEAHPDTAACGCTTVEGWEQYAMTRGADLLVRIDGGDYEFMFIAGESSGA